MSKGANLATVEEDVQRLLQAAAGTILLDLAQRHPAGGAGAHAPNHADSASVEELAQPPLTAKGTEPGGTVGSLTAVEPWNMAAGRGGDVDGVVWARQKELLSSATFQITGFTVELLRMQQDVLELSAACIKVVNVMKRLVLRIRGSSRGTVCSSQRSESSTSSLLYMGQAASARPEGPEHSQRGGCRPRASGD